MRLDYNILWFENDEGWFKQAVKGIRNLLDDYGFRLNDIPHADGSKINELITAIQSKVLDVDMIFMDFKLSGSINGEKLIETIRSRNLYTEILFYSMDENVKQIIEDSYGSIEGIYYSGRDNFRDKAKEVIWHTIKKVEDVESMRGLIMGAVAEIDETMVEIISSYLENCSEEDRVKISEEVFSAVEKYQGMKAKQFAELQPKLKLKQLIKDPLLFDADKKALATQSVINIIAHDELTELAGDVFYKVYKGEIIKTRNNFAHVTVVVEDGVRKLKSKSTEELFTDERCIAIRKSLIGHIDNVSKIKSIIINK